MVEQGITRAETTCYRNVPQSETFGSAAATGRTAVRMWLGMTGGYLAFDLGAETGRAVRATLRAGILKTEEIHRFPNDPVEYGGALHWDAPRLWHDMQIALS